MLYPGLMNDWKRFTITRRNVKSQCEECTFNPEQVKIKVTGSRSISVFMKRWKNCQIICFKCSLMVNTWKAWNKTRQQICADRILQRTTSILNRWIHLVKAKHITDSMHLHAFSSAGYWFPTLCTQFIFLKLCTPLNTFHFCFYKGRLICSPKQCITNAIHTSKQILVLILISMWSQELYCIGQNLMFAVLGMCLWVFVYTSSGF